MDLKREGETPECLVLICFLYPSWLPPLGQHCDLFTNPSSPEDVHVLGEMRISKAPAMQIVTQQWPRPLSTRVLF